MGRAFWKISGVWLGKAGNERGWFLEAMTLVKNGKKDSHQGDLSLLWQVVVISFFFHGQASFHFDSYALITRWCYWRCHVSISVAFCKVSVMLNCTCSTGSVGVICGNPSRALRARRQERNAFRHDTDDLGMVHPEELLSGPRGCCLEEEVTSFEDVMNELHIWRKHFHKVRGASDEGNTSNVSFSSTDLINSSMDVGGQSEDLDGLTFVFGTKTHNENVFEACPSAESSQTTQLLRERIPPPVFPLELRPPDGVAQTSASLTTRRRRYRIPTPEVSLHASGTLSLDFSNSTPSLDLGTSTPRSDHSTSTPRSDHSTSTPRSEHSTSTPRSDHSTSTPHSDHSTSTPRSEQSTSKPSLDLCV
uniref:Uncharacterized protein n=2 Tax=Eptatretus burgeri TaxID=7764 RepID=A0A8C4QR21_EPTBU